MGGSWRIAPEAAHKRDARHLWLGTGRDEQDGLIATFHTPSSRQGGAFAELMEVERQAGIVYAHRALAVPSDSVFMLTSISLELPDTFARSTTHPQRGSILVAQAAASGAVRRSRTAALRFAVRSGATGTGTGSATVTFLPEALYERVRYGAVAMPTRAVAMREVETARGLVDVATTGRIRAAEVRADLSDPILADHTGDHLSAMAMVCSIEDAVRSMGEERVLAALHIAFMSYAEFTPSPTLLFTVGDDGTIEGAVHQSGLQRAVFSGRTVGEPTHH